MLNLVAIGSKIATLRKQQGLTQNELAEALYVTHQAVSKWEQGKSVPTIDVLYELTKLFHISIDFLIDDAEIKEDDYDTLFETYPRDVVINQFLRSDDQSIHIDQLFYRLTKSERLRIINHIIHHSGPLEVQHIWPYLNNNERTYLLGSILSGTLEYNLQMIQTKLTTEEQMNVQAKYESGDYPYRISIIHHSK